jgi:DNA (cytosine-5)-methyltransferase 1
MVNTLRGRASNPDTEAKPGSDGPNLRVPGETGLSDFWDQFDIAECRAIDGSTQYRRIEPGLQPLATGLPDRVGRIRGFGNAIVPQLAATFIRAFLEAEKEGE